MENGGVVVFVPPNSCWPLNCVLPSETICWTAESICWMTACRCEALAVEPTALRAADWTEVRRFETLERVESVWLKEDWLVLMFVCIWVLRSSRLWMPSTCMAAWGSWLGNWNW